MVRRYMSSMAALGESEAVLLRIPVERWPLWGAQVLALFHNEHNVMEELVETV